jgi:shikimate dehydrogenase
MKDSLLCGLIGAGIQRSLSPALQQDEARHHGIRLHYQLIDHDASSRGAEALPIMGFAGLWLRRAMWVSDVVCRRIVS